MVKRNVSKWLKIISRVISCDPKNSVLMIIFTLLLTIVPTVTTYIESIIINLLLDMRYKSFMYLMISIFGLLIIFALRDLIKNKNEYYDTIFQCNVEKKLYCDILSKLTRLKYNYFEDAKTQDLIYRIKDSEIEKCTSIINISCNMIRNVMSILLMAVLIGKINYTCSLLILLLEIPLIILAYKNGSMRYHTSQDATNLRRKSDYFQSLFFDRNEIYELHTFHSFEFFKKKWKESYVQAQDIEFKGFVKYFIHIRLTIAINTIFLVMIIIYIVSSSTIANNAGFIIAYIGNLISIFKIQTDELPVCISKVVEACKYEEDYEFFMRLEELETLGETKSTDDVSFKKLVCKNVSFGYPGTEKNILDNISFTLDLTKRYAIVGTNGAGKTTLVKLLVGLFNDYEGNIQIDGKEIKELNTVDISNIYSVVFQDYSRYSTNVFDNLLFGATKNEANIECVRDSLKKVDLISKIDLLPQKEMSEVGLLADDGTELSGGQWQKIALARAIVKSAPITILDEPLAALDPIAEYSFYNSMKTFFKRGTIIISHRLMSAKDVDEIIVLDKGKVIQMGSHEQLMNQDGLYKTMYEKQRSWYVT